MSERTIVSLASSTSEDGPNHAIIWVAEVALLKAARERLVALRAQLPGLEELVFTEGSGFGVKALFGDLDEEALEDAEKEALDRLSFDAERWSDLADPDAPVSGLMEEEEEDFGSVRIHVREDCFYATASYFDGEERMESYQIPY